MTKYIAILAILAASCATTISPDNEASSLEAIKANIQLPNGTTITQVSYSLTCAPTPVPTEEATGTWPVVLDQAGQAKANGTIGGLDPNDTCTLVISAQDSWGEANNIQNCRGEADGLQVEGGVQINLVCIDKNVIGPTSGNITADVTVVQGTPYQCSSIGWYTSSGNFESTGYVFSLNMGVTVPTSSQVITWSSSDPSALWYQPLTYSYTSTFTMTGNSETDPATHASPSALNLICNNQGSFTVTLTVQDTTPGIIINGQPGTCPASTDTFPITCY